MTHHPAPGTPPAHDPATLLRRQASRALSWAIVLCVLAGLMILGRIAGAAQGLTSPPSSGAEALGRLVAAIGLPLAAVVGAMLLHRRRGRLLRQALALESAHYGATGHPLYGHVAQPYRPPHLPPAHAPQPNHPAPLGHMWPPNDPAATYRRPGNR